MSYLLDTNICIYVIKKKPECVLRRLRENMQRGLCISSITLAELQYGVSKSAYPEKNAAALLLAAVSCLISQRIFKKRDI